MSREASYVALFGLLQGLQTAGTVVTCDRKLQALDKMNEADLPAVFMTVTDQLIVDQQGMPAKRTLGAFVYVYVSYLDPDTSAGTVLNNLIDAVDLAIDPSQGNFPQTLGGLVERAWIEGKIEIFEGVLGTRAAAVVPIHMLVP